MFTNSKLHDTIEHDTIARKPSQPINKSITHQNINNVANKVQQPTPLIDISVPPPLYNPVWHQKTDAYICQHCRASFSAMADLGAQHILEMYIAEKIKGNTTVVNAIPDLVTITN